MQCAALGLEPNTVLGHAYLIPFDNRRKSVTEVQVVVGYKGLIDLARRSGHITSISANIHYSDDDLWEYEEGTEARLRHRLGPQEGDKLHAYAIAKFTDGGHAYVVLPWAQVVKIRNASQGYKTAIRYNKKDTPWITHEDAMAKKTAIRALAKYLPLSVEFVDAVQIDHDAGAKVDYASFAVNPEDGPTIDGEFVEEDAKPESEPTAESQTPQATQKPEEQRAGQTDRSSPSEAAKKHRITYNHVVDDIQDGAPIDGRNAQTSRRYPHCLESRGPRSLRRANGRDWGSVMRQNDLIRCVWTGRALEPDGNFAMHQLCDRLGAGEVINVDLDPDRSVKSHNHQFAFVRTAWQNMPEQLKNTPFGKTADTLRKHALIETGYCDTEMISGWLS